MDLPEHIAPLVSEATKRLDSTAEDTLDVLIYLRAQINDQLEAAAGFDWDDEYPDVQQLCGRITARIEKLQHGEAVLVRRQMQMQEKPKQRWRVIRTKTVDLSVPLAHYVEAVNAALQQEDMPRAYRALEKLFVFLRDDPLEYSEEDNIAGKMDDMSFGWDVYNVEHLHRLKVQAIKLLENPEKDDWDRFLSALFSLMRHREKSKASDKRLLQWKTDISRASGGSVKS